MWMIPQRLAKAVGQFFAPQPSAAPQARLQVLNLTRRTVLATQLAKAHTGVTRRKGLLGREALLPGEGLWIAPCESVHTFFMRFPIDLVYLDRKLKVKKVRHSVAAWRMSACFAAYSVLELPAGTAEAARTECGDSVEMVPVPASSQS
jgi:hypothetical protein